VVLSKSLPSRQAYAFEIEGNLFEPSDDGTHHLNKATSYAALLKDAPQDFTAAQLSDGVSIGNSVCYLPTGSSYGVCSAVPTPMLVFKNQDAIEYDEDAGELRLPVVNKGTAPSVSLMIYSVAKEDYDRFLIDIMVGNENVSVVRERADMVHIEARVDPNEEREYDEIVHYRARKNTTTIVLN
jgi:hypothetical protein